MSALERVLLKKSFLTSDGNFSGPLMRFVRQDVKGPHRLTQKRPRSFVSAPKTVAAPAASKTPLSRDFGCRSIFDFFNNIRQKRSFGLRLSTGRDVVAMLPQTGRGPRSLFAPIVESATYLILRPTAFSSVN